MVPMGSALFDIFMIKTIFWTLSVVGIEIPLADGT